MTGRPPPAPHPAPPLAPPLAQAAELLGPLASRDVPLGPLTTYRVGGAAALFVRAEALDDLHLVADAVAATRVPVLIVGKGSNLLVADEGFPGLAVSLGAIGADIDIEGTDVVAGGGVALPVLARRTAAAALTGLEWAVGVPGSVGGAVRMNAGGHGSDVAASLISADVLDLRSASGAGGDDRGTIRSVPVDRLGLRFRGSALGDLQIVVRARFRLAPGHRETSERDIADIVRWRRDRQPGGQNAGSVFVNPIPGQLAAAELVDGLGLRGLRIGTASVSLKHANFIQADDGGRAADVKAVIDHVRARVAESCGIRLRSEVRLVGFAAGGGSGGPEAR